MTKEQLGSIKWGNRVRYEDRTGKVTQDAPTWFMVTWDDSDIPEIVKRQRSPLTEWLELVAQ